MIEAHGLSDRGRVRPQNEDVFRVAGAFGLAVVADGMGGQQAGEVAARLAVDALHQFVRQAMRDPALTWPFGFDPTRSFAANALSTGIRFANLRVTEQATTRNEYRGMGTTIVVALVCGNELAYAGIGDSRAYLVGDAGIRQLTRDDSWIETAIAVGAVAAESRRSHAFGHVLTKALGVGWDLDVEVGETALAPGDLLLLCSDGLTAVLGDAQIAEILRVHRNELPAASAALVAAANAAGGPDNITVVLARPAQAPSERG
jgi:protein phosphatase